MIDPGGIRMDILSGQAGITKRLNAVTDNLMKEFGNLYCRNDFTAKLYKLKNSDKASRPGILKELFRLFEAMAIPYKKGMPDSYYEEMIKELNLPTFQDMKTQMMQAL